MSTDDLLARIGDLIDGAGYDGDIGPDAMRWTPEAIDPDGPPRHRQERCSVLPEEWPAGWVEVGYTTE